MADERRIIDESRLVLRAQAGDREALLEAGFLAACLLLADLKDRTQVLMLLNFAGLLSIVALAAVALATFISRHTLRVLRSVELLRAESGRAASHNRDGFTRNDRIERVNHSIITAACARQQR